MDNKNELKHHGTKGMKWGVRRYQNKDGSLKPAGRKRQRMSQDAKEAKDLKKKRLNELSNAELKKLNERKNLERNYKQLNPNVVKRGFKIATGTAAALGTIVALKTNGKQVLDMGKSVVDSVLKR